MSSERMYQVPIQVSEKIYAIECLGNKNAKLIVKDYTSAYTPTQSQLRAGDKEYTFSLAVVNSNGDILKCVNGSPITLTLTKEADTDAALDDTTPEFVDGEATIVLTCYQDSDWTTGDKVILKTVDGSCEIFGYDLADASSGTGVVDKTTGVELVVVG